MVYPNELFPTEARATAVGAGTAFSRIGSAAATYLMPFAPARSHSLLLLIGAVVSAAGLLVTLAWGVETRGRSLSETAAGADNPGEPSGPSLTTTT
ncbi:MFS transporter [Streptomyces sp. NPDC002785]|uniref:MFS transporter n=1 Tax=Streptomyces sp. NPDC002785 TaxID=3154543 RepID=UPI0033336828